MISVPDSPVSHRLRVAIPMLTLVRGGMGGSETYAKGLLQQLAGRPEVDPVSLVSAAAAGFGQGVREVVVPKVKGGGSSKERILTLAAAATSGITRRLAAADVVHYPFTVPVPRPPRGVPWVQSLLDVQHRDLPELFTRQEKLYRSVLYDAGARRADAVITISQFAKDQAVQHLHLDPAKVHVAHLGVDLTDFVPYDGVRENFVLYPARGWPHKNHVRLIEAMTLLRQRRPGLRLVLTGGGLDTLPAVPDWVDVKGLVSYQELLALYRSAACLAFPSLYEGFGLPPLEAMASGCPVAAADSGSIGEVCGDGAVLFDAKNPAAIADGIDAAITAGGDLFARGLERAASFTWAACADVHVKVYEQVAAGRRPGVRARQ